MQRFSMSNVFANAMYGFLNKFSMPLTVLIFTSGMLNFFALLFTLKSFITISLVIFLFGIASSALALEKPCNATYATYTYTLSSNTLEEKKFSFWLLIFAIVSTFFMIIISIVSIASNVPYIAFNFPESTNVFFIILYVVVVALYVIFPFLAIFSLIYLVLHLLEVASALANKDVDENWNKSVRYIKAYITEKENESELELAETSLDTIKSDILTLLSKHEPYKMLPRTLQLELVLLAFEKVSKEHFKKMLDLYMVAISIAEFPDLDESGSEKTKEIAT